MRDYIPYGPFLVIGGIFALLWGRPIMDSYLDLERETGMSEVKLVQVDPIDANLARPSEGVPDVIPFP
jgi:hypothetical protein